MSEHTMSEIPATPMDAIKQIYKLFQHVKNFTTRVWARDYRGREVTPNDVDACCWCLNGVVFHVYNMDNNIADWSEELPKNIINTFKLLWEKLPANLKFGGPNIPIWCYIEDIAEFNDVFGYTEVMRLLQAVIDDTEYMQEV